MVVFLWVCALGWAAFFTVGYFGANVPFLVLLIGWAPAALIWWVQSTLAKRRAAAFASALASAGLNRGSPFEHLEGSGGIALNPAAKTVMLMERGAAKSYPYADIRGWEDRSERAGAVAGGGLQGVAMTLAMESQAKAASGFYVSVRDVEHPQWRVAMKDPKARARWAEILRQNINEGGSAA